MQASLQPDRLRMRAGSITRCRFSRAFNADLAPASAIAAVWRQNLLSALKHLSGMEKSAIWLRRQGEARRMCGAHPSIAAD
jgi:hypothetical protein